MEAINFIESLKMSGKQTEMFSESSSSDEVVCDCADCSCDCADCSCDCADCSCDCSDCGDC